MKTRSLCVCALLLAATPAFAATRFQVSSTSGTKHRTVVTTKTDEGFVVLADGTRIDGKIQLHIINDDTLEVRLWVPGEKDRREYPRPAIHHFGLKEMSEDEFKASKDESRNFQPGWVQLVDGTRFTGRVAAVKRSESGPFPTAMRFIPEGSKTVTEYEAGKVLAAGQTVNGSAVNYETFRSVLVPLLVEGALVLARNPYPTTKNGFLSGVANVTGSVVADQAQKAENKRESKNAQKKLDKIDASDKSFDEKMKSAGEVVRGVEDNHATVETSEVAVMAKEFLVRKAGSTEWTALTGGMFDDWAGELYAHCRDYQVLDDGARHDLRKFSKIEESIQYFNAHCGH